MTRAAALLSSAALFVGATLSLGCPGGGGDPDTKMPVNSPVPDVDPPKEETPAPAVGDGGLGLAPGAAVVR